MNWEFFDTPMSKSTSLEDIKHEALFIQEQLVGTDHGKVMAAYQKFQALVDRFYSENKDIVTERQYRAARDNYDYFIILVETALNRLAAETENPGG